MMITSLRYATKLWRGSSNRECTDKHSKIGDCHKWWEAFWLKLWGHYYDFDDGGKGAWQGWAGMAFGLWERERELLNPFPNFGNGNGNEKSHSQLLGTGTGMINSIPNFWEREREWQIPFPTFGNGNETLLFPGMIGNGNGNGIKKLGQILYFVVKIRAVFYIPFSSQTYHLIAL